MTIHFEQYKSVLSYYDNDFYKHCDQFTQIFKRDIFFLGVLIARKLLKRKFVYERLKIYYLNNLINKRLSLMLRYLYYITSMKIRLKANIFSKSFILKALVTKAILGLVPLDYRIWFELSTASFVRW